MTHSKYVVGEQYEIDRGKEDKYLVRTYAPILGMEVWVSRYDKMATYQGPSDNEHFPLKVLIEENTFFLEEDALYIYDDDDDYDCLYEENDEEDSASE